MKILFFYTYNSGFLSAFYQELSKRLLLDGYDVVVSYIKNTDKEFVDDGIKYVEFQNGNYISKFKNIYKVIKLEKPDLIISNFGYINPALLFGKILKVPKNIAWMHTIYGHQQPSKLKILNKQFYLKLASLVIANSYGLNEEMSRIYKVPNKKIETLPFWTSIIETEFDDISEKLSSDEDYINIGCPGRLLKDKNHQLVIRVIKDFIADNKKVKLYIAGGGPNWGPLNTFITENNLSSHIYLLGVLSSKEMKSFFQSMNVIVLPSLNESFGLVLIEALAMGVPVIVSKAFGALEFIDRSKYPIEQFTFNPKSSDDLKSKLKPYINKQGFNGQYFMEIYQTTFKKDEIYQDFLRIIDIS